MDSWSFCSVGYRRYGHPLIGIPIIMLGFRQLPLQKTGEELGDGAWLCHITLADSVRCQFSPSPYDAGSYSETFWKVSHRDLFVPRKSSITPVTQRCFSSTHDSFPTREKHCCYAGKPLFSSGVSLIFCVTKIRQMCYRFSFQEKIEPSPFSWLEGDGVVWSVWTIFCLRSDRNFLESRASM